MHCPTCGAPHACPLQQIQLPPLASVRRWYGTSPGETTRKRSPLEQDPSWQNHERRTLATEGERLRPSGSAMPRGMNGIFNVVKPAGLSSHAVVSAVRRMSRLARVASVHRSGSSALASVAGGERLRVGHAGTLDPMATGVLLICVGQAVRVAEYLTAHDKKYRARIRLGVETDTYDATGTVVAQREVSVTREQVENALGTFVGKIAQTPPAYSAIKREGVPLYKLARRGVAIETRPRQVEIYSIILTDFASPECEIEVHCSKGTYMRALAHDLGEKLACGAHLTALTRTASGSFTLDDAVTLEQLRDAFLGGYAEQLLNPLDEALLQFEAVIVDPDLAKRLQQGNALACGRAYATPLLRAYSTHGELIALLERGSAPDVWKPKKVFLI